jgi:hypothetical protein
LSRRLYPIRRQDHLRHRGPEEIRADAQMVLSHRSSDHKARRAYAAMAISSPEDRMGSVDGSRTLTP